MGSSFVTNSKFMKENFHYYEYDSKLKIRCFPRNSSLLRSYSIEMGFGCKFLDNLYIRYPIKTVYDNNLSSVEDMGILFNLIFHNENSLENMSLCELFHKFFFIPPGLEKIWL